MQSLLFNSPLFLGNGDTKKGKEMPTNIITNHPSYFTKCNDSSVCDLILASYIFLSLLTAGNAGNLIVLIFTV